MEVHGNKPANSDRAVPGNDQPSTYEAISYCSHNCPDACGIRVGVRDGKAVSLRGDDTHPITRGFLCGKVNRYAERLYHPQRILTPLRRVGAKGEGRFAPISWDDAIAEITTRFKEIIASHGAEAILPWSFSGSVGKISMNIGHRFFHALGASDLMRTICNTQSMEGQRHTTGPAMASAMEKIPSAKLIIVWGHNAVSTGIHLMPLIRDARKQGAKLVVIDPHRNHTAKQADWYLPIRPGTDAALALGMMRLIITEGLADMAFVDRYTLGFEELREACEAYTPAHVAELTGLAEDDIVQLAREYAATKDAFIRLGLGLTRRRNGGMVVRTIACLPALTGAWEGTGGGFRNSGVEGPMLNLGWLTQRRPHDPPARKVNMLRLGEALLDTNDPPVQALYVYNSNPAAVAPDQTRVHEGLRREDLFVVVHDQVPTDTTNYADIVLPATTFLEQHEITVGSGYRYLQYAPPAVPPLGEAKSNLDTFRLLARGMGMDDPVYTESLEQLAGHLLQTDWAPPGGFDMEAFWAGKPLAMHPPPAPWAEGGLATPSGKFEFFSATLADMGHSPVPDFTASVEGHLSPARQRYPLQLCTPHGHHMLNSSFMNTPSTQKLEGRPMIRLHPDDAAARGLADGDPCRVFNSRGDCLLHIEVSENVRPGVAVADSVWWPSQHPGGRNINALISADQTDMGGGALYQDCLVEVEAAEEQVTTEETMAGAAD